MGTRADFYIAREDGLEWLGSIAWDGYPDGFDEGVLGARSADEFAGALKTFASDRDDFTSPERGWPWPWETSHTTDFAYVLIEGEGVVFSSFGGDPYWANRRTHEDDDHERAHVALAFPDMSSRKAVAAGTRSGTIMVGF